MVRNIKLVNNGFWFGGAGIAVGVLIGAISWGPKDFKNTTGGLLLHGGTCVVEMNTNFETNVQWCSETWSLIQELDKK